MSNYKRSFEVQELLDIINTLARRLGFLRTQFKADKESVKLRQRQVLFSVYKEIAELPNPVRVHDGCRIICEWCQFEADNFESFKHDSQCLRHRANIIVIGRGE